MTQAPTEERKAGFLETALVAFARASVYVGLFMAVAGFALVQFLANGGDSLLRLLASRGPIWWAGATVVWLVASLAMARRFHREDGHLLSDPKHSDVS